MSGCAGTFPGEVCRRVLVFREGRLIADGEPGQLAQKISGKGTLLAEISGDGEAAESVLRSVPGLLGLCREGGIFKLDHAPGDDIREAVFDAAQAAGLKLLMLKPEEISLESIYLALTDKNE